jgi:hypothetical protein
MAGSTKLYILATIGLHSNDFLRDYRLLVTDIKSSEPAFKMNVEFVPEARLALLLQACVAMSCLKTRIRVQR